jgi:DNA polymerase-3 subunit epsilon
MKHRPLVFLDIETTGGSADRSRITEIGALRVEDGKVTTTYKQLINPEQPIPYFISKLTGITNEMVWDAPTFRDVADDLELFLDGAIFIAHHVVFDYSFIKAEFKRVGYEFNMDRACSVKLSRRLHPEYRRHGLDKIIQRMGLIVEHRHRAFDDAEVIWKFFSEESLQRGLHLFSDLNKVITYTNSTK